MIVPAPILHIVDKRALNVYTRDGQEQQQQLLLNYCIGHAESSVLLCPNTNAILINHYRKWFPAYQALDGHDASWSQQDHKKEDEEDGPNARFQWSTHDRRSDQWRKLTVDQLWNSSTGGQRGLFMEVVALRDIAEGEEVTVDYGPDWERAWNQHVERHVQRQEAEHRPSTNAERSEMAPSSHDEFWKMSIQVANEQEIIQLQSGDLRKTTWHENDYLFTGCEYDVDDEWDKSKVFREARPDWPNLDNETLLRLFSHNAMESDFYNGDDNKVQDANGTWHFSSPALMYSTHGDELFWPCTVIGLSSSSSEGTNSTYTVRIHQREDQQTPPWAKNELPRFLTNFPRNAIHYFVKPQASDQQHPEAFRHFIGLPPSNAGDGKERTTFPEQWKNLR